MGIVRDQVHCSATAAEIIDFLASGAGLLYRVTRLTGSSAAYFFRPDYLSCLGARRSK